MDRPQPSPELHPPRLHTSPRPPLRAHSRDFHEEAGHTGTPRAVPWAQGLPCPTLCCTNPGPQDLGNGSLACLALWPVAGTERPSFSPQRLPWKAPPGCTAPSAPHRTPSRARSGPAFGSQQPSLSHTHTKATSSGAGGGSRGACLSWSSCSPAGPWGPHSPSALWGLFFPVGDSCLALVTPTAATLLPIRASYLLTTTL